MRTLILTRGTPSSGKSTWIQRNGLEAYTLEPDRIRLMFQSPQVNVDGSRTITQRNDTRVWDLLFQMLEARMEKGELVVVDATHSRTQQINKYRPLAQKYRYRVVIIDFSDVPLDKALEWNRSRQAYKFVPEDAIRNIHERLSTEHIPGWVQTIKYNDIVNITQLFQLKRDFSKYSKIVVFGDIHSCASAVKQYFTSDPFDPTAFYIFVGDYFDRGIETIETFKLIHSLMQQPNTLMLTGNHEIWLGKHLFGEPVKGKDAQKTMGELSATFDKSMLKDFYNRLGQVAYFEYQGSDYVVTHGGIPCLPDLTIPTNDYIKGVGAYSDSEDVDLAFIQNTQNTYSIHGHRNIFKKPVKNTERSYNLTGNVEFGGTLEVLVISPTEHKVVSIQNDVYDHQRAAEPVPNGLKPKIEPVEGSLLDYFHKQKDVNVRDVGKGIYSVNFDKRVFFNRTWSDINTKARGLFLDAQGHVVARSWDKTFNWGEHDSTSSFSLRQNLQFPVIAYEKYNGFLGILSRYNSEWFISSKSTVDSSFAKIFAELITSYLTPALRDYIESANVSLVFEVIHHSDPHIIEYQEDHVVLLDIIENKAEQSVLPYIALVGLAERFGFKYKAKRFEFQSYEELYTWRKSVEQRPVFVEDIEGYMLVDSVGFMWKYKTPFYSFWKRIRTLKDSYLKRGDHPDVRKRIHTLEEMQVWNALKDLDVTKPIIELRKDFFKLS